MKKLSFILLASIIAFSSCKKDDDNDDPIVGQTISVSENITENVVWTTGNTYIIENSIRVSANITIEKGVTVKFKEDAELDIAYSSNEYATVVGNGTVDDPIIFTSASPNPQPGDWEGVFFYKGANNCKFTYCTFSYGGSYDYYGMIHIEEASVSFENCTFMNSQSNAITLFEDGEFTSFTRNTMRDNAGYHIDIYPNHVHTIGLNNSYDAGLGIIVSDDENLDDKGAYTWLNQAAPYYIEGTVRIGAIGSGVDLTIEAGTVFKFMEGAEFNIAYSSDHYAKFTAIGTVDKPIVFASANPVPVKGDWDGLFFYNGTISSRLSHCQVKYGGAYDYYGMLALDEVGTSLTIDNVDFSYSESHAITVDSQSSLDLSNNITFSNIDGSNYEIR
jgi:hypothetical protein